MSVGLAPSGPVGLDELASIVDAVWACALTTADTPVPGPLATTTPAAGPLATADTPATGPLVGGRGPWWRAEVSITGIWDGRVSVECTQTAAVTAASYMLALSPELVGEAEVRDALGELANVVGGGVKSLLPDCNQLSLPVVQSLAEPSATGRAPACRLALTWQGEPFVVTVAHADVEGT